MILIIVQSINHSKWRFNVRGFVSFLLPTQLEMNSRNEPSEYFFSTIRTDSAL